MFRIWRIEGAGFELSMLIAMEFGQFLLVGSWYADSYAIFSSLIESLFFNPILVLSVFPPFLSLLPTAFLEIISAGKQVGLGLVSARFFVEKKCMEGVWGFFLLIFPAVGIQAWSQSD